jgi:hypothetical protein
LFSLDDKSVDRDVKPPIAFQVVLALCILTNILWYWTKYLLRARGYPISFIYHYQDLRHLNQAISKSGEDSAALRRLRIALYCAIALTLASFIWFFSTAFTRIDR